MTINDIHISTPDEYETGLRDAWIPIIENELAKLRIEGERLPLRIRLHDIGREEVEFVSKLYERKGWKVEAEDGLTGTWHFVFDRK